MTLIEALLKDIVQIATSAKNERNLSKYKPQIVEAANKVRQLTAAEPEKKLYEITAELVSVMDEIERNGGEITDENEELLAQLDTLLTTKADSCVSYYKYLEDRLATATKHADEINQLVKTLGAKKEKYEHYITMCMERMEKPVLRGNRYEVKFRTPSKVVKIDNPSAVPVEFHKVALPEVKINITALKKVLKEKAVPGARLVDGKRSLIFTYIKD